MFKLHMMLKRLKFLLESETAAKYCWLQPLKNETIFGSPNCPAKENDYTHENGGLYNPSFRCSITSKVEACNGTSICRTFQQLCEKGHWKRRCSDVSSTEALHKTQSNESKAIDFLRRIFLVLNMSFRRSQ